MSRAHASVIDAKVDALLERASKRANLTDLGASSWREGLTLLVDGLETTEDVVLAGRDRLYDQFVDALWNRLRVIDYVKQHPEVTQKPIERPLVILGLPRTGTTVASCLLGEDPARRSLLNWEALDSVPPARPGTLRTDARCLKK